MIKINQSIIDYRYVFVLFINGSHTKIQIWKKPAYHPYQFVRFSKKNKDSKGEKINRYGQSLSIDSMNPVGTESNPSIDNTKTLQPAITTALNTIENIVWLVGCCEFFVTNLHRHHSAIDDNGNGNSGIGGGRGGGSMFPLS